MRNSVPILRRADMLRSRNGVPCKHSLNYPLCPTCHAAEAKRKCSSCQTEKDPSAFEGSNKCTICRLKERKRRQYKGPPKPTVKARTGKRCRLCEAMTHRVVGPKCRGCGLLYAPEVIIGDAWKRKPSQWALLMSGGAEE